MWEGLRLDQGHGCSQTLSLAPLKYQVAVTDRPVRSTAQQLQALPPTFISQACCVMLELRKHLADSNVLAGQVAQIDTSLKVILP